MSFVFVHILKGLEKKIVAKNEKELIQKAAGVSSHTFKVLQGAKGAQAGGSEKSTEAKKTLKDVHRV